MKQYQLDVAAPVRIGLPLIAVETGEIVEIDATLESVSEGVLATAEIYAVATGECIRCLDPVEVVIDRQIRELYRYEPTDGRGRKAVEVEDDLDNDEDFYLEGNDLNLELPVIDAIILNLPSNPLCDDDCQGLCPDCGEKWATLPEDHAHEVADPRWAGLSGLDLGESEK
jgi:uncharacterized protein